MNKEKIRAALKELQNAIDDEPKNIHAIYIDCSGSMHSATLSGFLKKDMEAIIKAWPRADIWSFGGSGEFKKGMHFYKFNFGGAATMKLEEIQLHAHAHNYRLYTIITD